jgi:hypothetical protein
MWDSVKNTVDANVVDAGGRRWKAMKDAGIIQQLGRSNVSRLSSGRRVYACVYGSGGNFEHLSLTYPTIKSTLSPESRISGMLGHYALELLNLFHTPNSRSSRGIIILFFLHDSAVLKVF